MTFLVEQLSKGIVLLDLVDGLTEIVLHSHEEASGVQDGVVMGPVEGFDPGVTAIIRHIDVRPQH